MAKPIEAKRITSNNELNQIHLPPRSSESKTRRPFRSQVIDGAQDKKEAQQYTCETSTWLTYYNCTTTDIHHLYDCYTAQQDALTKTCSPPKERSSANTGCKRTGIKQLTMQNAKPFDLSVSNLGLSAPSPSRKKTMPVKIQDKNFDTS